jgi:septal ring-binding cell division protein DamX
MASGGKRSGAGERVLESRHVIGLFLIMMLFSAGFFTLGYLMGRDQNMDPVHAAAGLHGKPEVPVSPKPEPVAKRTNNKAPTGAPTDTTEPAKTDWEFYHAGDAKKPEDHLKPVAPSPTQPSAPVLVRTTAPPRTAGSPPKPATTPLIPGGAFTLQVAALTKESDAMELATRLQKKKFPAFVLSPQADKYYRVQVGPYADQKAADVARKGLEGAGFKAIVKH